MFKKSMLLSLLAGLAVAVFVLAGESSRAMADVITYDDFESYTPGDTFIGGTGGTGWAGAYTSFESDSRSTAQTKSLTYSNGDITVDGGDVAGRYQPPTAVSHGTVFLRELPAITSDEVYFSFLMQVHSDGDMTEWNQFGLQETNVLNAAQATVIANGTKWSLRAAGTTTDVGGATVANDQTYFVVVKAEKIASATDYNRLTVFIDPDDLVEGNNASTSLDADTGMDLSSGGYFGFRKSSYDSGDDQAFFDNFRVGTTFESVVVPEPGSVALMLVGFGLFGKRRAK